MRRGYVAEQRLCVHVSACEGERVHMCVYRCVEAGYAGMCAREDYLRWLSWAAVPSVELVTCQTMKKGERECEVREGQRDKEWRERQKECLCDKRAKRLKMNKTKRMRKADKLALLANDIQIWQDRQMEKRAEPQTLPVIYLIPLSDFSFPSFFLSSILAVSSFHLIV